MERSLRLHLRAQIVLALAALMLLAFLPLFYAVASLARTSLAGLREEAARERVATVADLVVAGGGQPMLDALARAPRAPLHGAVVVDADGGVSAQIGTEQERRDLLARARADALANLPPSGEARSVHTERGWELEVAHVVGGGGRLVAYVPAGSVASRANPLVRLVALYMAVFAVALLTFAYFALTRLIVRPLDALVRATHRVAAGARTFESPAGGPRELVDLAEGLSTMARKLLDEEARLRAKVAELTETTRRLKEARAQVVGSERMASVGRLAAGVAHEIGNPIAALMGMEELLLDGDLDASTQRDFLVRMKKETERIHGVLRDLLDFARPDKPEASEPLSEARALVSEVVNDVVALVQPQKQFRSTTLELDLERDLAVQLSSPRLTQVLLNLLLNAGDAARAQVRVTSRRTSDAVEIAVEDDGPGIPPDLRDQIFEPFMTTKDVGQGTGLGLSVCRGLVDAAGGSIRVDPAHTSGARFVVVLPAAT